MLPIIIDIALGVVIGLTLGLLGGGGSILTVPALVYIVGQSPQAAVTASLIIVGMNSMMGTFFHRGAGNVELEGCLGLWRGRHVHGLSSGGAFKTFPRCRASAALCPADARCGHFYARATITCQRGSAPSAGGR